MTYRTKRLTDEMRSLLQEAKKNGFQSREMNEVIGKCTPFVKGTVTRIVQQNRSIESEDLTNECLVLIAEKLETLKDVRCFYGWAWTLIRRHVFEKIGKAQKQKENKKLYYFNVAGKKNYNLINWDNQDELLSSQAGLNALKNAIGKLKEDKKEIESVLDWLEGKNLTSLAEEKGIPPTTLHSQKERGKNAIIKYIREHEPKHIEFILKILKK